MVIMRPAKTKNITMFKLGYDCGKRKERNTLGFWRKPRDRSTLVQLDSSLISASVHQQVDRRLLSSALRTEYTV